MGKSMAWYCFLAMAVALVYVSQAQDSSCLNQLIPCLEYINSNKTPTGTCCDPLKLLVNSDPKCLCDMLGGNSSAQQAGVNVTAAERLPSKCGLKVTAASCTGAGSPTKRTTVPSSASKTSLVGALVAAIVSVVVQIS